jgi:hypothetical protein
MVIGALCFGMIDDPENDFEFIRPNQFFCDQFIIFISHNLGHVTWSFFWSQ